MYAQVRTSTAFNLEKKWDIALAILAIHLGAILAFWTFSWQGFWTFMALQLITGMGVTLGFHRLLAHRSFQVPKWLEYLITICGTLSLQGGTLKWVATHRVHHAYSDRPGDPHSPNRGFWWAHMFWLFAYDEIIDEKSEYVRFVPDLASDPVHQMIHKTHVLQTFLLGAILLAVGGISVMVWGMFVRLVFVYHITWLVNSAAHIWGYQTYDTNEGSTNNWWVGVLSYGEGWHNNHHAFLHSAAHGLRWWEVDATYFAIRLLGWLGLAKRILLPQGNPARLPSPAPRGIAIAQPVRVPVPSFST